MKLLYATSARFPSPLANRIQVAAMAKALWATLGDDFVLGIAENRGQAFDGRVAVLGIGTKSVRLAWRYLRLAKRVGVSDIYCREEKLLALIVCYAWLTRACIRLWYEAHELTYLRSWWFRPILRRVAGIITLTQGTKDLLVRDGILAGRIHIAPDAVDYVAFAHLPGKVDARSALDLPQGSRIALYTGTIEGWKGVDTFYASASYLPSDVLVLIVGGRGLSDFEPEHPANERVRYAGHVPHERIPLYLAAADVLVVPNSARHPSSAIATSPMKVFEYMASGRPILASDVPSLREPLDDTTALFVTPDDPVALADGIRAALDEHEASTRRARAAQERARTHSWDERVRDILSFMQRP